MKYIIAAVSILLSAKALDPLPNVDPKEFTEMTYENIQDHFNYMDNSTYMQRYWVNEKHWAPSSGPVFIYICGEYTCSVPETRMFPFMMAASHQASMYVLEHRFYGESQLKEDWSTENLALLSSQQALADLATFITAMNDKMVEEHGGEARKWIVVGGSYPGALSSWFRNKYPHLATISWASSGVIRSIIDFQDFDYQVYLSSLKSGQFCPQFIHDISYKVTEEFTKPMPNDASMIMDTFGTQSMRYDDFTFYFADIFVESVQYGGRTKLCDMIKGLEGKSFQDQLKAIKSHGEEVGVNPPDYCSTQLQNTTIDFNKAGRQWSFQYCREFGFYQTMNEEFPMRSHLISFDYWPIYCKRLFGDIFPEVADAHLTNSFYGGLLTKQGRTFYVNGAEDPWQWAAMRTHFDEHTNQISRIADCDDCGHCVELYTPKDTDPQEVKDIRAEIRQQIIDWLAIDE